MLRGAWASFEELRRGSVDAAAAAKMAVATVLVLVDVIVVGSGGGDDDDEREGACKLLIKSNFTHHI